MAQVERISKARLLDKAEVLPEGKGWERVYTEHTEAAHLLRISPVPNSGDTELLQFTLFRSDTTRLTGSEGLVFNWPVIDLSLEVQDGYVEGVVGKELYYCDYPLFSFYPSAGPFVFHKVSYTLSQSVDVFQARKVEKIKASWNHEQKAQLTVLDTQPYIPDKKMKKRMIRVNLHEFLAAYSSLGLTTRSIADMPLNPFPKKEE